MTEDDNLVYDIEGEWEMHAIPTKGRQQVFIHKQYHTLYRIIDFDKQTYTFNDIGRIDKVIDIQSKLTEKEIERLTPKFLAIINAERPISMPYKPEKLTLYICKFDDILGILYYRIKDKTEDNVYPIKRYFEADAFGYYDEISADRYLKRYNDKFIRVKGD